MVWAEGRRAEGGGEGILARRDIVRLAKRRTALAYDPRNFQPLTFHDAVAGFRNGSDTPRAYLERAIETIAAREPVVKAFAHLNQDGARAAADASAARWKAGKPLSPIDGMPVAIKDLLETRDMPTEMGCEAFRGN